MRESTHSQLDNTQSKGQKKKVYISNAIIIFIEIENPRELVINVDVLYFAFVK